MELEPRFKIFRDANGFRLQINTPRGIKDLTFDDKIKGFKPMRQVIQSEQKVDENGNPTGGVARGFGIEINWQDGPLGNPPDLLKLNGAFVEGVLEAARQRLQFLQTASDGRFACRENSLAITKIEEALHWLDHRTMERNLRGVEGTHAK